MSLPALPRSKVPSVTRVGFDVTTAVCSCSCVGMLAFGEVLVILALVGTLNGHKDGLGQSGDSASP
jgi:hypothetical protein